MRLSEVSGTVRLVLVCVSMVLAGFVAPPVAVFSQSDIRTESDIVFAVRDGVELKMDIAYPEPLVGSHPALVYISGSGWGYRRGWAFGRHQFDAAIRIAAVHGYVAAEVGYRPTTTAAGFATGFRYPDQLLDVRRAVRWLRAHADRYHIDSDHIGAVGWSSGGHLALMLGFLSPHAPIDHAAGSPSNSSAVEAVVSIAGPTDLRRLYEKTQSAGTRAAVSNLMGGSPSQLPRAYRKASPVSVVTACAPPVLLIHGTADRQIPYDQSTMLFERMADIGAPVELATIIRGVHYNDYLESSIFPFLDSLLKPGEGSVATSIREDIRVGCAGG